MIASGATVCSTAIASTAATYSTETGATVGAILRAKYNEADGKEGEEKDGQRSKHNSGDFLARVGSSSDFQSSEHCQRDVRRHSAGLIRADADVTEGGSEEEGRARKEQEKNKKDKKH